jgi:hypothetical protein
MLIALSCVTAAPIVASAASAPPVASTACVHARIGGEGVCLANGQKCNHHYEGQYLRYGFTCTKHGHKWRLSREQQGQQQ